MCDLFSSLSFADLDPPTTSPPLNEPNHNGDAAKAPEVSDVPPSKLDQDQEAAECGAFPDAPPDMGKEVSAELQVDEVPIATELEMEKCCEISPAKKWDWSSSFLSVFLILICVIYGYFLLAF